MADTLLIAPLIACAVGAAVAGLIAATPLQKRVSNRALGWLLAIAPALAFALFVGWLPAVNAGQTLTWAVAWMPTLGVQFAFTLDGLSELFALLITGIGAIVVVYAGYYFAGHGDHAEHHDQPPTSDARFFFYLLLFMTAMLGLVLASDVITLFLFWEGTSITSFLLIAYNSKDAAARQGAFKALFITGGGGIALLAGLVFAAVLSGSTSMAAILNNGDALRQSAWYPIMLGLIAFGAFAKSAQVPLHFWLPSAMSAPTPASTYLHSATMVKAGIYLLARMHPALGDSPMWFGLLVTTGALTMISGAVIGLRQVDMKALLAFSTVSQLGVLVMLIGLPESEAFKALVVGILAHALYKAALFLVTGIVDHQTGSRDLRRLGVLWRVMPASFLIGGVAAMSMAGLPPMLGFLAKETLLASVTEHNLGAFLSVALPALVVATGALMLAQAGSLILDAFVTQPGSGFPARLLNKPLTGEGQDDPEDLERLDRAKPAVAPHEPHRPSHDAPIGMLLGPGILAALSLVFALAPTPAMASLLAVAAGAAYGGTVKVSLDLFHGVNLPLVLSLTAIALGVVLFVLRSPVRNFDPVEWLTMDRAYAGLMNRLNAAAALAARAQAGRVRHYLMVMLVALFALVALFGGLPQALAGVVASSGSRIFSDELTALNALRAFSLVLVVGAAFVSVVIRRDLFAIIALGASGLAVAILIALEPSPDVALVQVIVDLLSTVVLVLALSRLPRAQRLRAEAHNGDRDRRGVGRDVVLASLGGAMVFVLCAYALLSRPRTSNVTPYYEANSKPVTGAADIVGAIVVDFRGFDTMIEITVFSMAGIGVFSLLRYAMKKREAADLPVEADREATMPDPLPASITGIGGERTSPFVHLLAQVALPVALVVAFVQMVYGHEQPGDGFTAGVTVSLAVAFWYVVFGYEAARQRLSFLRPGGLIGVGLLFVLFGSISPVFMGGTFFSPVDFGEVWHLPLPEGFYISTSFLFEIAICLAVLGASTFIVDTLGRPREDVE